MNPKSIFPWTICFLHLLFAGPAEATNLKIMDQTGTEKNVEASELRTITFNGANLNLNFQNGTTDYVTLSSIRKMYFSSVSTLKGTAATTNVVLYPNPVAETLILKNLPEGRWAISVWNIMGHKVLSIYLSSESATMDVGSLESGLYFIRINNQTLRFCKK
jgi:hypothetical protein